MAELQIAGLVLTFLIAVLNLLLVPLTKSAVRGEVAAMFKKHDDDPLAHPGIALERQKAVSVATFRADEAVSAASRTSHSFVELRDEMRTSLRELSERMQTLHEAFIEHDSWERARYENDKTLTGKARSAKR